LKFQNYVTETNSTQTQNKFVGILEPSEMDFSKNYAARKYQKRQQSRKKQIVREKANLNSAYDNLVEDIRKMRVSKQNKQNNLQKKVGQLERLKKQKKRYKRIASAMAGSPDYIEKFGVPILDMLNSIVEAAKMARDVVGEKTLKCW
jgi:hypothetical protein